MCGYLYTLKEALCHVYLCEDVKSAEAKRVLLVFSSSYNPAPRKVALLFVLTVLVTPALCSLTFPFLLCEGMESLPNPFVHHSSLSTSKGFIYI